MIGLKTQEFVFVFANTDPFVQAAAAIQIYLAATQVNREADDYLAW